ncbi:protoheme IX farnesyltransferase [Coriobacteriia bacterium Es71-Z0120]|uniref:protoheme IX farnesyltransferase n=1 Tax=Parvivirga hydrogeniphila TaxID=2939460 RepID=UPI002260C52B|nr:protoheme IX farnesyltransferase [Parvivirga hydrogeniphila]MCL4078265.1 protoheme IX farnesyltransferase [Parvivirga hydrogeniphila]
MGETEQAVVKASQSAAGSRFVLALLSLTKPKQTGLLLVTAVGAYVLTAAPTLDAPRLVTGISALALAISGCTVLNMVLDRDIDAKMDRTASRPLPRGEVSASQAVVLGASMSTAGLVLAGMISATFLAVVGAGLFFDLVVYTAWLKRRSPLSILVGGVSGGMPALAGRVLALGRVDAVGVMLALGVVLWIPAHILTLATRHAKEYEQAGVPVWPSVYGERSARRAIAVGSVLGTVVLTAAGLKEDIARGALIALAALGLVLDVLALLVMFSPTDEHNWALFKAASAYMLGAFLCLTFGAVLAR